MIAIMQSSALWDGLCSRVFVHCTSRLAIDFLLISVGVCVRKMARLFDYDYYSVYGKVLPMLLLHIKTAVMLGH